MRRIETYDKFYILTNIEGRIDSTSKSKWKINLFNVIFINKYKIKWRFLQIHINKSKSI